MPAYSHTTSDRTELRKEKQVSSREERLRALLDEAAQAFPTALELESKEFIIKDTCTTARGEYSFKVGTILNQPLIADVTICVEVDEDANEFVYAVMGLSGVTSANQNNDFDNILIDFLDIDDVTCLTCNYDAGEWEHRWRE